MQEFSGIEGGGGYNKTARPAGWALGKEGGGGFTAPQPSGDGGHKGFCKRLHLAGFYKVFRNVVHAMRKITFGQGLYGFLGSF